MKKLKITNPTYHVIYWIIVVLILTLVFGRSWSSGENAFYYIGMLLPIMVGTSYYFNLYLVPQYLMKKRYFWFGLYFIYMLVVSLYLQTMVAIFSFIYLTNFGLADMAPNTFDLITLMLVMYLVVFVGSFFMMLQQLAEGQKELLKLKDETRKNEQAFLELTSNRKLVRIPYNDILFIESLSDYICVHSEKQGEVTSKEKISSVVEMLPKRFIRIHRSFIVNADKVTRVTATEVYLNELQLNIGRTYKNEVASVLKAQ